MTIEFVMTSQASLTHGIKCCVYGDAGIGKTMLAATMPKPLILAVEAGLLSLSKNNIEKVFGKNTAGITYDIPVMKIANGNDLNDAWAWVSNPANSGYFDSLALDSVTEFAEVILSAAKRSVKDPRQAYGELLDLMGTYVRAFAKLPGKNVLMTAKMEPLKDELTGVVKQHPMMPGAKLGPRFAYEFDEVFHMGVSKDTQGNAFRYFRTQPDLQYVAKDRSGALATMEYPHLGYVFQKIVKGV
jgi:AAA domain